MSLFEAPKEGPKSLRDNPKMQAFDFTGEEELLVLNDAAIASHQRAYEAVTRLNQWVDDNNLDDVLGPRVQAALDATKELLLEASAKALLKMDPGSFADFYAKTDPIAKAQQCIALGKGFYEGVLEHLDHVRDFAGPYSEGLNEQVQRAAVEMMKVSMMHIVAYNTLLLKFIERIEHGVPAWDFENACEGELEPGIPTFDGSNEAKTAAKQQEQQAETATANRLLARIPGLFDDVA